MRPYLPALLILGLLTACEGGSVDKIDIQAEDDAHLLALIEVYQPANGSVLPAGTDFIVDYAVVRGINGAYVIIRIDDKNPVRINSLNSRHRMQGLAPGRHTLLIEGYNADGQKTNGTARIDFTVE